MVLQALDNSSLCKDTHPVHPLTPFHYLVEEDTGPTLPFLFMTSTLDLGMEQKWDWAEGI